MTTMAFDEWVRAWFDRPEDWDWIGAEDLPELPGTMTLEYATRLFQEAGALLQSYSDTQVGTGLYALIDEMDSPLYALQESTLPREARRGCLRRIYRVFKDVFAARCPEKLRHYSEKSGKLSSTCYMWWDVFPLYTGACPELDSTVLAVMERTLMLPHAACQESALHGLGHWQRGNPERVAACIGAFLASGQVRRPELVAYAKSAREGMVL